MIFSALETKRHLWVLKSLFETRRLKDYRGVWTMDAMLITSRGARLGENLVLIPNLHIPTHLLPLIFPPWVGGHPGHALSLHFPHLNIVLAGADQTGHIGSGSRLDDYERTRLVPGG